MRVRSRVIAVTEGCRVTDGAAIPSRLCMKSTQSAKCQAKLGTVCANQKPEVFMMTKFITQASLAAGFAVAAITFSTVADAQTQRMRFEGMDINRDGVISRTEWRGSDRAFINQDWDGNGELSGDEVRPGARRNANLETADHVPNRLERYNSWTQAGFSNLDHN